MFRGELHCKLRLANAANAMEDKIFSANVLRALHKRAFKLNHMGWSIDKIVHDRNPEESKESLEVRGTFCKRQVKLDRDDQTNKYH